MILCDHHIDQAIREGRLVIDPAPDPGQFDSSSLNLRVGHDFRTWRDSLGARGTKHLVDLDDIDLVDLIDLTEPLEVKDEVVVIPPRKLVLVRTLEYLEFPLKGRLAARVEGRSKQARLGMTAHITAPTIHAGFAGTVVLEIFNHGPFHLEARVKRSQLCQLIVEEVSDVPRKTSGSAAFARQDTPLGSRKPR
jgi:dCTP deaminase